MERTKYPSFTISRMLMTHRKRSPYAKLKPVRTILAGIFPTDMRPDPQNVDRKAIFNCGISLL